MLGNFGAVGEAANLFDIVMKGEGYVALPIILRFLEEKIAQGEINQVEGVPWEEHVPALAEVELPRDLREFVCETQFYPPVLGEDVVRELFELSGLRYVAARKGGEGTWNTFSASSRLKACSSRIASSLQRPGR